MKRIIVLVLMVSFLFGAKVTHKTWEKGTTFSEYLESRNVSATLFESISAEDQKFLTEIESGAIFYELKNDSGILLQALIPINKEMQIHLAKEDDTEIYKFDIIPIEYKEKEYYAKITIENNPYSDTLNTIKEERVAERISLAIKGVIDAKKLRKNDELTFTYNQKTRLGKLYDKPDIKVVRVKMGKTNQFIYVDEDGYGYEGNQKSEAYTVTGKKKVTYTRRVKVGQKSSKFIMPLRHVRVTSSFSYRRFHPILKRYRPHHGTDFGARKGTPLLAVNSGKVTFSGWMGGYGNVVKIRHAEGYESLYAHQSRRRVKRGQRVKKGQIIGYVGSTGRSTGPHLHFGLKKNGRWVNPMRVLRKKSISASSKTVLKKFTKYEEVKTIKYRKVAIEDSKMNKIRLLRYKMNKIKLLRSIKDDAKSFVWDQYKKADMRIQDGK